MRRFTGLLAIASAPLLALACSGSTPDVSCHVNSDCASSVCLSNGTCAPLADAGIPLDAGSIPDAGPIGMTYPDGGLPYVDAGSSADAGPPPLCGPSADGSISRSQFPVAAGLHATYVVAQNATFATAGTVAPDGGTIWDFTGMLSGDTSTVETTNSLDGGWFAGTYPSATYTSALSPTSNLLGVFQATESNLLLLGVVSPPDAGSAETELTYSPPVVVLQFPITPGATWQTTSNVTGLYDGIDIVGLYSESYVSSADAIGVALTPYADFAVQRISTQLTRTVGFLVTTETTYTYDAACFGGVATVVSQSDLGTANFTDASLVERLAP